MLPNGRAYWLVDEFAARVITQKPLPWGNPRVEGWADEHDTHACEWMQEQGIPVAAGVVGRGYSDCVAREHCVHPVRSYLHALNWDRTPRLVHGSRDILVWKIARMSKRSAPAF